MTTGEEFIIMAQLRGGDFEFACECIYDSPQVLRFKLTHKTLKMEVQKIIFPKTRFAWKLTNCNFEFKKENAGENMNILFNHLDEAIKNPMPLLDYFKIKKSW